MWLYLVICTYIYLLPFNCVIAYPAETFYEEEEIGEEYIEYSSLTLTHLEENIGMTPPYGWYVEGDIWKTQENRQAVKNMQETWVTRHIPFVIDNAFSAAEQSFISDTLQDFHDTVGTDCINFRPKTKNDVDYVYIQLSIDSGCTSVIGRLGGEQSLLLTHECVNKGTIFHELMHVLGFWHEHNRPDRDQYVKIQWDNIIEDSKPNFYRNSERDVQILYDYDYYSIMHYSPYAFRKDVNVTTIVPLDPNVDIALVGQRTHLTEQDKRKIRKLYQCDAKVCEDPGSLKNGHITKDPGNIQDNTFNVGDTVSYECSDEKYVLIGPRERMCTNNSTWTGEVPVCLDLKDDSHYCNFDNDSICGWDSQWKQTRQPTPNKYTGPTWDHTWQSSFGYYMYADGEKLLESHQLQMISPLIDYRGEDYCISFTTSMSGDGMGSLNISTDACGVPVYLEEILGNQGTDWMREVLKLKFSCPTSEFRLVFTATEGTSIESDIAIDDVLIADCDVISDFLQQQKLNATPQRLQSIG